MKKKKIGKFRVHPIGIGTWAVGGGMLPIRGNEEEEIRALRYSFKKGQNHIDTAEIYGRGHSEEVVGQAIKGLSRERLFVATKVWRNNATKSGIPKAAETSSRRLDVKYVDLLYVHFCWNEPDIEDYIEGLNKAQDTGLTKAIGVSNFNLSQLKIAVSISKNPIVALQNHYNVMHQGEVDKKMKDFCKKNKITIVAYSPLENCTRSKLVIKLAEKYDRSPAQIAINWLVSQDNVVTIPKSTDKEHIDENLGSMDFTMDKKDIKLLNNPA
jgi:diketogulonate reductase-like aldo/keto reductase